jgi:hypothetical protein
MQVTPQRINHNATEPTNSVTEVEGAIRQVVRQDVANLRRESEDFGDFKTNVESVAGRASSLAELKAVIGELQRLHDFLHSEGERLQREIADYAHVSKAVNSSVRLIADNIMHRKKAGDSSPT